MGDEFALIDARTFNDFQFLTNSTFNAHFYFCRLNSHPSMYADPDFSESRIG